MKRRDQIKLPPSNRRNFTARCARLGDGRNRLSTASLVECARNSSRDGGGTAR
jgi:hypothetical protein